MLNRITAPFKVVTYEKSYLLWITFVVAFGLANVWGTMLNGTFSIVGILNEGTGYTFSISICAPLIAETFIQIIVNHKSRTENCFMTYKLISSAIVIILIVTMAFLWSGEYKDVILTQVSFCILSIAISFYLFCINQMGKYDELITEFDDKPYEYLQKENNSIKELDEKSKSIDKTITRNGDVKL